MIQALTAAERNRNKVRRFDSCLYKCSIKHRRFTPKKHEFSLSHFMFYLWLDELSELELATSLFGTEQQRIFRFLESDHFPLRDQNNKEPHNTEQKNTERNDDNDSGKSCPVALSKNKPAANRIDREKLQVSANSNSENLDWQNSQEAPSSLLERVRGYLQDQGVEEQIERVALLCNVRNFNYVFNPISCFYCFDSHQKLICCIVEVENTFHERKMYLLRDLKADFFCDVQKKYFYVSPFTELDQFFDFKVGIPGKHLAIQISTTELADDAQKLIMAGYIAGERHEFSDKSILKLALANPLCTINVIFLIHLHAAILWLKRIPFHRKEEHPELQTNVLNPRPIQSE